MSYWNADTIFTNALKRAGLYRKDEYGRDVLHIHCLRKFFFTRMAPILGREVTEALMGHKVYLDAAYRRFTVWRSTT
jgi:integrase